MAHGQIFMTDSELLQQLQTQGLLDAATAKRVEREALVANEPVDVTLAKNRLAPDEAVAQAKSALLKVPYKAVAAAELDAKLFDLVPEETVRTYGVVPLSLENNLLVVGMFRPDDPKAQEAVKFLARRSRFSLGVYLISYADWQAVLRRYSPYKNEVARAVQSINIKGSVAQKVANIEEVMAGEEAPIVKIVSDTFREAVASRASDIHIEPQEKALRIRFRIDGELVEQAELPLELAQPIISRIKVISNLKLDESRIPQDGRFRAKVLDKNIDFRVGTFPTALGEKVAIRVLDPSTGLKNFENLRFVYRNLEIVKAGLQKPFGMILMTGPTGSGKTTTLYAFLQELNREGVNIVSLEDPVEYFVAGVNQSQVRPEIGYDFGNGLREILRQDPDIVMVGEIRDDETAALAVQAALTGHVVLSTLHTNNAVGIIPRLLDMKVEPFLIPVSLNLMMSQRLLGVLCPDCKKPEPASEAIEGVITRALAGLPAEVRAKYKPPYQIWRAQGCATCKGRGIVDRDAIFEAFAMTPELETIVNSGPTVQKIAAEAKRQGMLTLRQDGILKALEGTFSMEEVLRETEE
jgi:type IV pilus assembly protein PilB